MITKKATVDYVVKFNDGLNNIIELQYDGEHYQFYKRL